MFTKAFEFVDFFSSIAHPYSWDDIINSSSDPSGFLHRRIHTSDESQITFQVILKENTDIMVFTGHRSSVNVEWKLTFTPDPANNKSKDIWHLAQITIPTSKQFPFYIRCNNSSFDSSVNNQDGILIYLDKSHPANWMESDELLIFDDTTEDIQTLSKHQIHTVTKESLLRISLNI